MNGLVRSFFFFAAFAECAHAQANGMMCPGVPFEHVCTFLQPANEPGGDHISMLISEDAVVQLLLDVNNVQMLTFEAIINQFAADGVSETQSFEVANLQGFYPGGGNMKFQGWGNIVPPDFAVGNHLHFVADTTELPLDENSGMPANVTVVLGEMTLHGLSCNVSYSCGGVEGGMLRFHSPGGMGGDFGQVPVNGDAPSGRQNVFNQDTQQWAFADVAVFHSVGGDARFNNYFGMPYQTFGVDVSGIPEPASVCHWGFGLLCVIRRHR